MKTTFIFLVYWFLISSILITVPVYAQPVTAQFETMLRFTDAIGNKDSVVIGYDLYATHYMDTIFGESAIENPFDSVFEVRASSTDLLYHSNTFSKKLITPIGEANINDTCKSGFEIFLYIQNKYPPFTVEWDSAIFKNDNCKNQAFFCVSAFDWQDFMPLIYPPNTTACLAHQNSAVFNMTLEGLQAIDGGGIVNILDYAYPQEVQVAGQLNKLLYPLRYSPYTYEGSLCYTIMSAEDKSAPTMLFLAPNPATSQVQLQFGEALPRARVRVYTLEGRQVAVASGHALMPPHTIDVGHLPKGIYFVQVYTDVGLYATQKLVVQ